VRPCLRRFVAILNILQIWFCGVCPDRMTGNPWNCLPLVCAVILATMVRSTRAQQACSRSVGCFARVDLIFYELQVVVSAHTAYVRVNSPLSNAVASRSDVIVDAAVSAVYANVFGVSNQAQVTSNSAVPATNAFNRPRAGLVVSVPGMIEGSFVLAVLFDMAAANYHTLLPFTADASLAMPEATAFTANSRRLLDGRCLFEPLYCTWRVKTHDALRDQTRSATCAVRILW
jgi:hypothetical protein